jgi:geranylgeranyl pyrophosphate synthase
MPTARSAQTTSRSELEAFLAKTRDAVRAELDRWSARVRDELGGRLGDAMAYSLAAPGKALRPALVVAAYRAAGGTGDVAELATAVEIVHTYSLVHDDLPCMDDDDLRRGRPTTHVAFDVPLATEVGFRLVPLSARVLAAGAERIGLPAATLGRLAVELYRAAGAEGMVAGQVLDLEAEGLPFTPESITRIHRAKTGALIAACAVIGAIAAGAEDDVVEAVRGYGWEVGVAFQIVDDVLDATQPSDRLGKTAGKDAEQRKASFAAALGVEGARTAATERVQRAMAHLDGRGLDCGLLTALARLVLERTS